jgi:hypothetical protein
MLPPPQFQVSRLEVLRLAFHAAASLVRFGKPERRGLVVAHDLREVNCELTERPAGP